jgi:hypothetical protein
MDAIARLRFCRFMALASVLIQLCRFVLASIEQHPQRAVWHAGVCLLSVALWQVLGAWLRRLGSPPGRG